MLSLLLVCRTKISVLNLEPVQYKKYSSNSSTTLHFFEILPNQVYSDYNFRFVRCSHQSCLPSVHSPACHRFTSVHSPVCHWFTASQFLSVTGSQLLSSCLSSVHSSYSSHRVRALARANSIGSYRN